MDPDREIAACLAYEYGYSRRVLGRGHRATMRWLRSGFPRHAASAPGQVFLATLDDRATRAAVLKGWQLR